MALRRNYYVTLRRYLSLTKPGVLFGNVITGVAGFCLASAHERTFSLGLFVATILGMTLIIAAACTLNNVFDQDIDRIMERTKQRAVAVGTISATHAKRFAAILGLGGVSILALWTNWLVVSAGIAGFVVYVWLYGVLTKRRSIHGTLVGSISGAVPILSGYVAASGRIDSAAVLVFLALFFWQFPEFYAIAIYRRAEYEAARVSVITVVKGVAYTKWWIAVYAALFVVSALLLTVFHYTGYLFAASMTAIGFYWLRIALQGFGVTRESATNDWARRMFRASLHVILLYSVLITVGPLLP